jgi:DUF2970 family protein
VQWTKAVFLSVTGVYHARALPMEASMSNDQQAPNNPNDAKNVAKPNLFQVLASVLAGLFGVQSAKNRERDFKKGRASDYILIYVILVLAMVAGMIITVNMVISGTGQ